MFAVSLKLGCCDLPSVPELYVRVLRMPGSVDVVFANVRVRQHKARSPRQQRSKAFLLANVEMLT